MIENARHKINKLRQKWLMIYVVECTLIGAMAFALSTAILLVAGIDSQLISIVSTLLTAITYVFVQSPKRISHGNVIQLLNNQNKNLEHSLDLVILSKGEMTSLQQIQLGKVAERINSETLSISLPNNLKKYVMLLLGVLLFWFAAWSFPIGKQKQLMTQQNLEETAIAIADEEELPEGIEQLKVSISPPKYTGVRSSTQSSWKLEVEEGTIVTWQLSFHEEVKSARLKFADNSIYEFSKKDEKYDLSLPITHKGFYEFQYTNSHDSTIYSDLFAIYVAYDNPPQVEVEGLEQHNEYDWSNDLQVVVNANVSDDYGLTKAYLVTTLAKGSGESIQFREERVEFDNELKLGTKSQRLTKRINFAQMDMDPGDELYFYIAAKDNFTLRENISKSETYILKVRDTVTYEEMWEGGLGVDLMPDYFRSQRQLIIDTEKLIKNRSSLTAYEFNSTSNELGFDQKALRLKYGQFLGVEDESGIAIEDDPEELDNDHAEEGEEESVLKGYMHDHDHEDEHVRANEGETQEDDPLDKFQHNHDDEEEATFFNNTIKGKLRAAMALMWDSELYLRLYKPEESLSYQYKALKLIKEIKNHARVYVHRMGFEPSPIKQESRLTGDLDGIIDGELIAGDTTLTFPNIRLLIQELGNILSNNVSLENQLIDQAGNELATLVLQNPTRYMYTMQLLKETRQGTTDSKTLKTLRIKLMEVIPGLSSEQVINESPSPLTEKYLQLLNSTQP